MKAFPTNIDVATGGDGWRTDYGMDLRDYFAAKAMQGLLSTVKDEEWQYDDVAAIAFGMANAMMEERTNETN